MVAESAMHFRMPGSGDLRGGMPSFVLKCPVSRVSEAVPLWAVYREARPTLL